MAGNTGKMTAAALAVRGPRMRVLSVYRDRTRIGVLIDLEGQLPLKSALRLPVPGELYYRVYGQSYTLGYLLRIAAGMKGT